MLQQYLQIKEQAPDAILFFRMGDFYEMFFEDAKTASSVLGLTLTSRSHGKNKKSPEQDIPLAGFPHHSVNGYINRLVDKGFKVAVCDQVEDPATTTKLVRRELTRIITPGTRLACQDEQSPGLNNFLLSINPGGKEIGCAAVDVATGDFMATVCCTPEELIAELHRFQPREMVLPDNLKGLQGGILRLIHTRYGTPLINYSDLSLFQSLSAYNSLCHHLKLHNLDGLGCPKNSPMVGAAWALLDYLGQTQMVELNHLKRLKIFRRTDYLVMDERSLVNLELVKSLRNGGRDGTLLDLLDLTVTAMGRRKIAQWLQFPLCNLTAIEERLDAVEELKGDSLRLNALRQSMKGICDLERINSRLATQIASPRDLAALGGTLQSLPEIGDQIVGCRSLLLQKLASDIDDIPEISEPVVRGINNPAPLTTRDGGIFRRGFRADLDELITLSEDGKKNILEMEAAEKKNTGISSLKIKYNKVFGYYIEVTRANLELVPPHYIRKQTLVNAERFITSEMKEFEDKVFSAEEKRVRLEHELFLALRLQLSEHQQKVSRAAAALARLDVLTSFAQVARDNHYNRPQLCQEPELHILGCRHPVVERNITAGQFVPNDLDMSGDKAKFHIITGPNMAGKSTYIRQVAHIALMAHIGSFVPADKALIGLVDRIFTRVGAADNLAEGMSTFMVEMVETANIINNATRHSLIILDEIGRGTSTYDGVAIAWSVAEEIFTRIQGRTLFATHYHELTDLALQNRGVENYHVVVKEYNNQVVFLHKLTPGSTNRSYGIEVAKLAGLPGPVIKKAKQILMDLENRRDIAPMKPGRGHKMQMSLFRSIEEEVTDQVRSLDLTNTNDEELRAILRKLQRRI